MKENSLKKNLILKKRNEIAETLKEGRRFDQRSIRIIILPKHSLTHLKAAFLVSKKLGKESVLRNKVKRWLREIFRQNKQYFPGRLQIIITAKLPYAELDYSTLKNDFLEAVRSEKFTDFVNQSLSEPVVPVQNG